jgi:hypothetical protein
MLKRVLETLESYNARAKRECEAREAARRDEIEMARRREASGKPTGIACPVCHHELGDGGGMCGGGKWGHDPAWKEYASSQQVICPHCGYEGWRVQYLPDPRYKPPQSADAVDPQADSTGKPTMREEKP